MTNDIVADFVRSAVDVKRFLPRPLRAACVMAIGVCATAFPSEVADAVTRTSSAAAAKFAEMLRPTIEQVGTPTTAP